MNYTTNYHLPQWDEDDRIMRTDFNQMCRDVEDGLTGNASAAAAAKAQGDKGVSNAAAAQTAANHAQTSANNAQSTANAALTKANAAYSPDQPPYVVGTYRGTGNPQSINLGFQPRFLIISGGVSYDYWAMGGLDTDFLDYLVINSDGFTVKSASMDGPNLVDSRKKYSYIAFR